MSGELAHYYFVPCVREGLASYISAPAQGERALIKATLTPYVDGKADESKSMCVGLYGSGDVVGFDPSVVSRTDPRLNVWDYEPNFMPLIEFSEPDLPWRFTPDAAASDGQLQPWIALIVLREEEFKGLGEQLRDGDEQKQALPFRWINKVKIRFLPDLQWAWMWAHVHVTAEDGLEEIAGALTDRVSGMPGTEASHTVARMICPRRLAPRTKYTAFVVPTFKLGRVAVGLASLQGLEDAHTLAWEGTETEIDLPY